MNSYQEHILDHYHHPRHKASDIDCNQISYCSHSINTSCGDQLTIALYINDDIITDIQWIGEGCAISQASASILANYLINSPSSILQKMHAKDMIRLLKLPLSPARIKCAILALETAQKALHNYDINATRSP